MLEISVLVRSLHILAAAAWVGGSLMYLVVVMPALRAGGPAPAVTAHIATLFKRMTNICIGILLLSGAYLTFERLTRTDLGIPYIVVLCIKIGVALGMFILAIYLGQSNIRRLAKQSTSLSKAAPRLMLALGILAFVLGAILNGLFEMSIVSH